MVSPKNLNYKRTLSTAIRGSWPHVGMPRRSIAPLVVVVVGSITVVGRPLQVTSFWTAAVTRRGHRWRTVLLLVLDPSVLEPDLHLLLGQQQTVGDFDAPEPRQVHVVGELSFQFQQLVTGERGPDPLWASGVRVAAGTVFPLRFWGTAADEFWGQDADTLD